jgi:5-methylcytosine-specific restriction endonuclease McrA
MLPRETSCGGGQPVAIASTVCSAKNTGDLTHHAEHIVAKQHGGSDDASNLALACHRCNLRKGQNLTAIDPVTREVVPLFHPRSNDWAEHFIVESERIIGVTAVGRATVQLLAMNDARRLEPRTQILSSGEQP